MKSLSLSLDKMDPTDKWQYSCTNWKYPEEADDVLTQYNICSRDLRNVRLYRVEHYPWRERKRLNKLALSRIFYEDVKNEMLSPTECDDFCEADDTRSNKEKHRHDGGDDRRKLIEREFVDLVDRGEIDSLRRSNKKTKEPMGYCDIYCSDSSKEQRYNSKNAHMYKYEKYNKKSGTYSSSRLHAKRKAVSRNKKNMNVYFNTKSIRSDTCTICRLDMGNIAQQYTIPSTTDKHIQSKTPIEIQSKALKAKRVDCKCNIRRVASSKTSLRLMKKSKNKARESIHSNLSNLENKFNIKDSITLHRDKLSKKIYMKAHKCEPDLCIPEDNLPQTDGYYEIAKHNSGFSTKTPKYKQNLKSKNIPVPEPAYKQYIGQYHYNNKSGFSDLGRSIHDQMVFDVTLKLKEKAEIRKKKTKLNHLCLCEPEPEIKPEKHLFHDKFKVGLESVKRSIQKSRLNIGKAVSYASVTIASKVHSLRKDNSISQVTCLCDPETHKLTPGINERIKMSLNELRNVASGLSLKNLSKTKSKRDAKRVDRSREPVYFRKYDLNSKSIGAKRRNTKFSTRTNGLNIHIEPAILSRKSTKKDHQTICKCDKKNKIGSIICKCDKRDKNILMVTENTDTEPVTDSNIFPDINSNEKLYPRVGEAPSYISRPSIKHAVRIGSSFSFNIEFYKENKGAKDVELALNSMRAQEEKKDPHRLRQKIPRKVRSLNKSVQSKQKQRRESSTCVDLRRCFCTLALKDNLNQAKSKKESSFTNYKDKKTKINKCQCDIDLKKNSISSGEQTGGKLFLSQKSFARDSFFDSIGKSKTFFSKTSRDKIDQSLPRYATGTSTPISNTIYSVKSQISSNKLPKSVADSNTLRPVTKLEPQVKRTSSRKVVKVASCFKFDIQFYKESDSNYENVKTKKHIRNKNYRNDTKRRNKRISTDSSSILVDKDYCKNCLCLCDYTNSTISTKNKATKTKSTIRIPKNFNEYDITRTNQTLVNKMPFCRLDECEPDCKARKLHHFRHCIKNKGVCTECHLKTASNNTKILTSDASSSKRQILNFEHRREILNRKQFNHIRNEEEGSSQRQAVRIGSSFSFNVEFHKDMISKNERVQNSNDPFTNRDEGEKNMTKYKSKDGEAKPFDVNKTIPPPKKSCLDKFLCAFKLFKRRNDPVPQLNEKNKIPKIQKSCQCQCEIKRSSDQSNTESKSSKSRFSGTSKFYKRYQNLKATRSSGTSQSYKTHHKLRSRSSGTSNSYIKNQNLLALDLGHRRTKKRQSNIFTNKRNDQLSTSSKNIVRISSSFSFNLEFYKERGDYSDHNKIEPVDQSRRISKKGNEERKANIKGKVGQNVRKRKFNKATLTETLSKQGRTSINIKKNIKNHREIQNTRTKDKSVTVKESKRAYNKRILATCECEKSTHTKQIRKESYISLGSDQKKSVSYGKYDKRRIPLLSKKGRVSNLGLLLKHCLCRLQNQNKDIITEKRYSKFEKDTQSNMAPLLRVPYLYDKSVMVNKKQRKVKSVLDMKNPSMKAKKVQSNFREASNKVNSAQSIIKQVSKQKHRLHKHSSKKTVRLGSAFKFDVEFYKHVGSLEDGGSINYKQLKRNQQELIYNKVPIENISTKKNDDLKLHGFHKHREYQVGYLTNEIPNKFNPPFQQELQVCYMEIPKQHLLKSPAIVNQVIIEGNPYRNIHGKSNLVNKRKKTVFSRRKKHVKFAISNTLNKITSARVLGKKNKKTSEDVSGKGTSCKCNNEPYNLQSTFNKKTSKRKCFRTCGSQVDTKTLPNSQKNKDDNNTLTRFKQRKYMKRIKNRKLKKEGSHLEEHKNKIKSARKRRPTVICCCEKDTQVEEQIVPIRVPARYGNDNFKLNLDVIKPYSGKNFNKTNSINCPNYKTCAVTYANKYGDSSKSISKCSLKANKSYYGLLYAQQTLANLQNCSNKDTIGNRKTNSAKKPSKQMDIQQSQDDKLLSESSLKRNKSYYGLLYARKTLAQLRENIQKPTNNEVNAQNLAKSGAKDINYEQKKTVATETTPESTHSPGVIFKGVTLFKSCCKRMIKGENADKDKVKVAATNEAPCLFCPYKKGDGDKEELKDDKKSKDKEDRNKNKEDKNKIKSERKTGPVVSCCCEGDSQLEEQIVPIRVPARYENDNFKLNLDLTKPYSGNNFNKTKNRNCLNQKTCAVKYANKYGESSKSTSKGSLKANKSYYGLLYAQQTLTKLQNRFNKDTIGNRKTNSAKKPSNEKDIQQLQGEKLLSEGNLKKNKSYYGLLYARKTQAQLRENFQRTTSTCNEICLGNLPKSKAQDIKYKQKKKFEPKKIIPSCMKKPEVTHSHGVMLKGVTLFKNCCKRMMNSEKIDKDKDDIEGTKKILCQFCPYKKGDENKEEAKGKKQSKDKMENRGKNKGHKFNIRSNRKTKPVLNHYREEDSQEEKNVPVRVPTKYENENVELNLDIIKPYSKKNFNKTKSRNCLNPKTCAVKYANKYGESSKSMSKSSLKRNKSYYGLLYARQTLAKLQNRFSKDITGNRKTNSAKKPSKEQQLQDEKVISKGSLKRNKSYYGLMYARKTLAQLQENIQRTTSMCNEICEGNLAKSRAKDIQYKHKKKYKQKKTVAPGMKKPETTTHSPRTMSKGVTLVNSCCKWMIKKEKAPKDKVELDGTNKVPCFFCPYKTGDGDKEDSKGKKKGKDKKVDRYKNKGHKYNIRSNRKTKPVVNHYREEDSQEETTVPICVPTKYENKNFKLNLNIIKPYSRKNFNKTNSRICLNQNSCAVKYANKYGESSKSMSKGSLKANKSYYGLLYARQTLAKLQNRFNKGTKACNEKCKAKRKNNLAKKPSKGKNVQQSQDEQLMSELSLKRNKSYYGLLYARKTLAQLRENIQETTSMCDEICVGNLAKSKTRAIKYKHKKKYDQNKKVASCMNKLETTTNSPKVISKDTLAKSSRKWMTKGKKLDNTDEVKGKKKGKDRNKGKDKNKGKAKKENRAVKKPPCMCHSKICKSVTKAKKKKVPPKSKPPPCICGSKECKKQLQFICECGLPRNPKEKEIEISKMKKQKEYLERKQQQRQQSKKKVNQMLRNKLKNQIMSKLKGISEYECCQIINQIKDIQEEKKLAKRYNQTSDTMLVLESVLDLAKMTTNLLWHTASSSVNVIKDPKGNFKKLKKDPCKKLQDFCISKKFKKTGGQFVGKVKAMSATKTTVRVLESNPVTNYLLHVVTSDPKKKLQKKKQARKRKERLDFECSPYMGSLRKKPYLWFYDKCPSLYPQFISLLLLARQFMDVMLFLLAVVVWSPCILTMEVCRALMCCFLCTG